MNINRVSNRYEYRVVANLTDITHKIIDKLWVHVERVNDDVYVSGEEEAMLLRRLYLAQRIADLLTEYEYYEIAELTNTIYRIMNELEDPDL